MREIKAFKPEEYWTIDVDLVLGDKTITVSLDKVDGKTAAIHTKEEADALLARIGKTMDLVSLSSVERHVPSKLPFTTSTMQQEAYNRFAP